MKKLYQEIASTIVARLNCIERNNTEWCDKHEERILKLVADYMPSGSGIDCDTKIDLDKSDNKKLVFFAEFHHMNDGGYYDGWTAHYIHVTPSFDDIDLRITGPDRNEIKDYLHETFHYALTQEIEK